MRTTEQANQSEMDSKQLHPITGGKFVLEQSPSKARSRGIKKGIPRKLRPVFWRALMQTESQAIFKGSIGELELYQSKTSCSKERAEFSLMD